MFDRLRAEWEPARYPVDGPPFRAYLVNTVAVHYTADDRIPLDVGRYLANIQTSYETKRGYSIGYNAAVDQSGVCWELRGTTFKCAANRGYNDMTFAILMLVDGADPANDRMVARTRQLVRDVRLVCPDARIVGHRDIGSTACPGAGLYGQVVNGVFEPQKGPTMLVVDYQPGTANWVACVWTGTHLAWLRDGNVDQITRRTGVTRETVNRAEFVGLIRSSRTIGEAPPMDADLIKLWKKSA